MRCTDDMAVYGCLECGCLVEAESVRYARCPNEGEDDEVPEMARLSSPTEASARRRRRLRLWRRN
jgi:hypothetical protein